MDFNNLMSLAINKGYRPWQVEADWENESARYLELCFCQKWLRDEHKIIVIVDGGRQSLCRFDFTIITQADRSNPSRDTYETYEQALLEGISEGLRLI